MKFQNPSFKIFWNKRIHGRTHKPKAICSPLFQSWGYNKTKYMYTVYCHGNSCVYRLHTSFKTGYIISNDYMNIGYAYVSYLCSPCNYIAIKFTETWNILEVLLLASL